MVGLAASVGGVAGPGCAAARAVMAGMKTSGAGGVYPSEPCGRTVLKCRRQLSTMIFASAGV